MGKIEELWRVGNVPSHDGLYRPDDTGVELYVEGPGAYHYDAGQPVPWRLGAALDVGGLLAEHGCEEVDVNFECPFPDASGWMVGGGGGMGNIGFLARLHADRSLRWVAYMWLSNPFVEARFEGRRAIITNDWRNLLTLDLDDPALG
ncbi:hypothetical protein [Streptomyces sp. NPDC001770]